jgi:indole-3-glycerol phosphate synthase
MTNILAQILAHKQKEIDLLDTLALRRAAESSPISRDFLSAIKQRRFNSYPSLIAELKRASPSKGILAPHLDLFQVADIYAEMKCNSSNLEPMGPTPFSSSLLH